MKKKIYEKPSVKVVKLQASVAMLEGSGTGEQVTTTMTQEWEEVEM